MDSLGMILIKVDNRYKDGNIVKKNGVLRGNADTMTIKRLVIPTRESPFGIGVEPPAALQEMINMQLQLNANPPYIIHEKLAQAITKNRS